jgi:hypothetical protein
MDETHVENGSTIALYLLPSILGVLKNKKNKLCTMSFFEG